MLLKKILKNKNNSQIGMKKMMDLVGLTHNLINKNKRTKLIQNKKQIMSIKNKRMSKKISLMNLKEHNKIFKKNLIKLKQIVKQWMKIKQLN